MNYRQSKGNRIKSSRFWGVFLNEPLETDLVWSYEHKKWTTWDERGSEGWTNCFWPCRSIRAFRKHLKKFPELRGKCHLSHSYVGYDVKG